MRVDANAARGRAAVRAGRATLLIKAERAHERAAAAHPNPDDRVEPLLQGDRPQGRAASLNRASPRVQPPADTGAETPYAGVPPRRPWRSPRLRARRPARRRAGRGRRT